MAVKVRLKRIGRRNKPAYRVVVAHSSAPRDGKFIEDVGHYNPLLGHDNPDRVHLKLDRIQHWIQQGAQMTERVAFLRRRASGVGSCGSCECGKNAESCN